MPYLGNDLQVAQPSYRNIDDISGSFNSSTTSFPLRVSGSAPVPFPINSNQCLISVAGVVQRPDDSGTEGFRISGGNIIFSSAPSTGADFFGVILAGADYVNVGANFPSGSAAVPSITFDSDLDTGIYNSAANQVSITTAGTERLRIDSAGQIESVSLGSASAPAFSFTTDPNTGIYSPGADQVAISTNGTGRLFVDSTGRVGVNTSSPTTVASRVIHVSAGAGESSALRVTGNAGTGLDFIQSLNGDGFIYQRDNNPLILGTNNLERLRITAAGLVGIGSTSPTELLSVNGNIWLGNGGGSGGSEMLRIWNDSGVERIHGSNNPSALAFGMGGSSSAFEAFRIDASRRLLVGTSTSTNNLRNDGKFAIVSTGSSNLGGASFTNYGGTSAGTASVFDLQRSRGTTDGSMTAVASGDALGYIAFRGSDGTAFLNGAYIVAEVDATVSTNIVPGRLAFYTTNTSGTATERMRIGNNGQVDFFGAANNAVNARTASGANATDALFVGYHSATTTSNGTVSFAIRPNGNVQNTNNSYGALSDIKLKENIVDASSQWLDIKALQVRKYNFKEETAQETHTQIGLVAQEVELVSPGLVSETPDRDEEGNDLGTVTKSVNYSVLYMKAVKALQEAMERIEQLEAEMAAVKAQLS